MFLNTFLFVLFAEMADKTQLMIMALTNRYRIKTILLGMSLGIFSISALSVICGEFISSLIPIWVVKICGACLFLFFGFLTLSKQDENANENTKTYRFPILSIAVSFLLAELGDKTQLATVAFAAEHANLQLEIFLGASLGLLLSNIIGIFAGKLIFSHISDTTMRIGSSFIFLFFGSLNIFEVIPYNQNIIFCYSVILITFGYFLFHRSQKQSI